MPHKDPEVRKLYQREYQRKNREYFREYLKNWRKVNPNKFAEYDKRYRATNYWRSKARNTLNYAVRSGKISRSEVCTDCGVKTMTHGHHPNHFKPLDVIWLCRKCHMKLHRK